MTTPLNSSPSIPHIIIQPPSDKSSYPLEELDSELFADSMYCTSSFWQSTLFSREGYELTNEISPLDLSIEGFPLEAPYFSDTPEFFAEYLTGTEAFGMSPIQPLQSIPSSSPPQHTISPNTAFNAEFEYFLTPSPSSSYTSLSTSPVVGDESPQYNNWSNITTPSSGSSGSPSSSISQRETLHHHSPSDPKGHLGNCGQILEPSTSDIHTPSCSESSMTRPVATQAMLEANQRRRRHKPIHACNQCGQTFTAMFSLRRHEQSHSGVRNFACGIPGCHQAFLNRSDCRRHERSKKLHKLIPL